MAIVECLHCGCRGSEYSARLAKTLGGFQCVSVQMCDRRRKRQEREQEKR